MSSVVKPTRLFTASCFALIVTAMSFIIRGGASDAWSTEFALSKEQIGLVNMAAFWGFTGAMVFGGPLCDFIGMKRIAWGAFAGHLVGIILTVMAKDFYSLLAGTLVFGIANGLVEAACNPLIAGLYPQNKTTKLNNFHVWFPGGIVIGGLLAFGLGKLDMGWRAQFLAMLAPLAVYGFLFLGQMFPQTERVQSGVNTGAMFKACLGPGFLLMVFCMLLTAATELAPGQWIPDVLTNAGVNGLLVLVWITGLMAVGRQVAGPLVHRLSPTGMLLVSAILSGTGLFLMSRSTSPGLLFGSATVFALGVCFFWPTMLGYVNERYPKTGALGLAIMGGAGMLSAGFFLPVIGHLYDDGIKSRIPADIKREVLEKAAAGSQEMTQWMGIKAGAGLETFGKIAALPALLVVVFLALFIADKVRGGYKAQKMEQGH